MNPTDLDELLRQHAQRWAEVQSPAPLLATAVERARSKRRPRTPYLATAACVLVVLIATATFLWGRRDGTSPAGPAGETGTVVGQYRIVGGPGPGINEAIPGTIWAYSGHRELSALLHARPVAHVNTDSTGEFTLSLAPGQYTLLAAQGRSRTIESSGCGVPVYVQIAASTGTRIDLICSVP
ncbi:MAG: hypothetical protein ABI429_10050 [Jatrophihabitantaceae bacterium]